MLDPLLLHELQHARLPCPSLSPGVCSNSCPLSQWCPPTISSSVAPFSSCPRSFTASGSFPMSCLFRLGGQSIGASAPFLPMTIHGWFPLGLTGDLAIQGTHQHRSSEVSILRRSAFFIVQLSHPYVTTGKTIAFTRWTFVGKVMSLLFNTPSRFVRAFLPRGRCVLISWLQSPSVLIMKSKKMESDTVSTVSPSICHEVMVPDAMVFVCWMLSFKPAISLSSFTFIKRLF